MSSTVFLRNAVIRHSVYLQRFAGGAEQGLQFAIIEARRTAKRILGDVDVSTLLGSQQRKIIVDIGDGVRKVLIDSTDKTFAEMQAFSVQETGFNERMLNEAVNATVNPARAAMTNRLVFDTPIAFGVKAINGRKQTINRYMGEFSRGKTRQIQQVIRDGILQGQSNVNMRRQLGVVSRLQARQADALIRTTVNHVSNRTRQAVAEANKDIVQGYIFNATLDNRTTLICGSLDGKQLPFNTPYQPPMHIACRSGLVPDVKEEFSLFPRETIERSARGPDGKSRPVDGRTNYNTWLRDQPEAFQRDILGTKRTELFRNGDLPIDRFVDHRFQPLNLDQLARTETAAFNKAGIDI